MKYGDTLQQRSIPGWSVHNIDYDEIKHLIKEHTTPGKGKAVSVPGTGDVTENQFEDYLFAVFVEQHQRIGDFVWSKAGEIGRRLDHLSKQIVCLNANAPVSGGGQLSRSLLVKYAKTEKEALRVGKDIGALDRFICAQRIAFNKLLKKYKKWTKSEYLEQRFRFEILDQEDNFCNMDLALLLDRYNDVVDQVRTPRRLSTAASEKHLPSLVASQKLSKSPASFISKAVDCGSEVDFDATFATVPLGQNGAKVTYWVHSDNLVELNVFLLQYTRLLIGGDRSSGNTSPSKSSHPILPLASRRSSKTRQDSALLVEQGDESGMVVIDQLDPIVQKYNCSSSLTSAACARWTVGDDAVVSVLALDDTGPQTSRSARLKRSDLSSFLWSGEPPNATTASQKSSLKYMRSWLADNNHARPLVEISCNRTRFAGLRSNETGGLWAILDRNIFMKEPIISDISSEEWVSRSRDGALSFPHAVLELRYEGEQSKALIEILNQSHLAHRIPGFSIEAHALWTCFEPSGMTRPDWLNTLSQDIRKVPEAVKRPRKSVSLVPTPQTQSKNTSTTSAEVATGSSTPAAPPTVSSATSIEAFTPRVSIADLRNGASRRPLKNISRPLRSNPESNRYWSEYDNPEDNQDGYYIYVNPSESSGYPGQDAVEGIGRYFKSIFSDKNSADRMPLLAERATLETDDDGSSSDEDIPATTATAPTYGAIPIDPNAPVPKDRTSLLDVFRSFQATLSHAARTQHEQFEDYVSVIQQRQHEREQTKARFCTVSMLASVVILIMLGTLADTGRKKQSRTVNAGILFGVVMDLLFVIVGVGCILSRQERVRRWHWVLVIGTAIAVTAGDGVLLAWIFEGGPKLGRPIEGKSDDWFGDSS